MVTMPKDRHTTGVCGEAYTLDRCLFIATPKFAFIIKNVYICCHSLLRSYPPCSAAVAGLIQAFGSNRFTDLFCLQPYFFYVWVTSCLAYSAHIVLVLYNICAI